jgi:hypothetical protein
VVFDLGGTNLCALFPLKNTQAKTCVEAYQERRDSDPQRVTAMIALRGSPLFATTA